MSNTYTWIISLHTDSSYKSRNFLNLNFLGLAICLCKGKSFLPCDAVAARFVLIYVELCAPDTHIPLSDSFSAKRSVYKLCTVWNYTFNEKQTATGNLYSMKHFDDYLPLTVTMTTTSLHCIYKLVNHHFLEKWRKIHIDIFCILK